MPPLPANIHAFLTEHHVVSLAACHEGELWSASCFYVFDPAAARLIVPLTTPEMRADFAAAGGLIMLATGFRITSMKSFPVANMLPSLLLIMPISYLWATYIAAH